MQFKRFFRAASCLPFAGLMLISLGCQPTVRENRTITFSPGGQVAFQHGRTGVFITDPKTGKPTRIYDPAPEDLAFSPPAWDPTGQRVLFTVAQPLDGSRPAPMGETPADGRQYAAVPVSYTCWLYDPVAGDKPVKLFTTSANHAGYVAAGLAVAWHPDGRGVDYVERLSEKQHHVCSFDLTSRESKPAGLTPAENIALGSDPRRTCRYALLGGAGSDSGLWLEGAGGAWWRVAGSEPDTPYLETLRLRMPHWSPKGTKLAFVAKNAVCVCDMTTRQTETWFSSETPEVQKLPPPPPLLANLHWHPDGTRIGLINGSRLGLVSGDGRFAEVATDKLVVAFAGWDAGGQRMAYVTTETLPYSANGTWATLMVPNGNARTEVYVAEADGAKPRQLVSGLRATFLHWSATQPKLSVWLTVEPPYRLADGRLGMRPGDPAAILDPATGKVEWLPVNGAEHAQIGHVELRTGNLDAALRRFDDAAAALPADAKADWMLFRAVALNKAGREAEAQAAWKRFAPPTPTEQDKAVEALLKAGNPNWPLVQPGLVQTRHQFVAEAFVSLDMADQGIAFFRKEAQDAGPDSEKLSAAVALCQLLLLTDKKEEYAECVAGQLLPLARHVLKTAAGGESVAWTVLPLAASEFLLALPDATVRKIGEAVSPWTRDTNDADYACQLVMQACGERLKDEAMVTIARKRLAAHQSNPWWKLPAGKVVDREFCMTLPRAFLLQQEILDRFANMDWLSARRP